MTTREEAIEAMAEAMDAGDVWGDAALSEAGWYRMAARALDALLALGVALPE